MATIRRRTGEYNKTSHVTDLPEIKEEPNSETVLAQHSTLLENGKQLFDRAAQSGYKETDRLAEGLKMFVDAAVSGSMDATDEIKNFLVTTSEKRLSFVLDQLPTDLLSTAKVIVKGSETEKQVFQVAKDMFKTMAAGKKAIKKDDIDEAAMKLLSAEAVVVGSAEIKSVTNLKGSVKRLLKFGLKTNSSGEETITEEAFCLVACQYARGELVLPLEADDYQLSSERYLEFLQSNWIKKITEFPKPTAHYLGQYGLKTVEKYGVRWVWSYIPTKQLNLMLLVYLIPLINAGLLLSGIATVVFLCAFMTMIISTLQIVANWRRINWFMEYSTIFRYFSEHGSNINTHDPEAKLLKNTVTPYISFSVSTVVTIFTISLAYQVIMVYELLLILSTVMTIFVFVRFKCWESPLIIGSIAVRLLGWSLVLLFLLQQWLPIPNFMFLHGKQLFSLSVFPSISMEINLITLVQVPTQLLLLSYLALRYSRKEFILTIGSYTLLMSWWIFSKQLFLHCSLLYLGLFAPAFSLFFFLTPLLPIALLMAPFICYMYFGMSVEFLVCTSSVVLIGGICLFVVLNYGRLKKSKWLNVPLEYLFLLQVLICVPVMYIGASYYASINSPSQLPIVTMEQYNIYCSGLASDGNMMQVQIDCMHFEGRVLTGKAILNSIDISSIRNRYVEMVDKFPKPIKIAMTCLTGEREPMCGKAVNSPTCLFKGCHFDSSNEYSITIKASTIIDNKEQLPSSTITLLTVLSHKKILDSSLMTLKQNMQFEYNATFTSGTNLVLNLKSLVFVSSDNTTIIRYISDNDLKYSEDSKREVFSQISQSFKNSLGFVLDTFLGYTSPYNTD